MIPRNYIRGNIFRSDDGIFVVRTPVKEYFLSDSFLTVKYSCPFFNRSPQEVAENTSGNIR